MNLSSKQILLIKELINKPCSLEELIGKNNLTRINFFETLDELEQKGLIGTTCIIDCYGKNTKAYKLCEEAILIARTFDDKTLNNLKRKLEFAKENGYNMESYHKFLVCGYSVPLRFRSEFILLFKDFCFLHQLPYKTNNSKIKVK